MQGGEEMTRTAGQLATIIKQVSKMDIAELGENSSIQDTYIFDFMSRALNELASLAFVVRTSDALNITQDGYVTFQIAGSDITDLYEPLRILDSNGNEKGKRYAFTADGGWWRESANTPIHVKGMIGSYVLQYKAYPKEITVASDIPEFPASGYMALVYWTCALVKESKDYFEEAQHMYTLARERLKLVVKANMDARGTTGGMPPSIYDVDQYFKA
jgi:hypothetical protein